jgi:hypothetical protein
MPAVKAVNPANPADFLMAVNGGKRRKKTMKKGRKKVAKAFRSRAARKPHKTNPSTRRARRSVRRRNPQDDIAGLLTSAAKVGAGVLISETINGFLPPSGILMDLVKQGAIGYGTHWGARKLRFDNQTANLVAAGTIVPLVVNIVRPLFNRFTSVILPAPAPVQVAPNAQPQQQVRGASGIALMPPVRRSAVGVNGIGLMPPVR